MKKLIYALLFCMVSMGARAQLIYHITFDTTFFSYLDSYGTWQLYRPYTGAISIDSTLPHNQWQIGRPNKTVFTSAYSLPYAIVTDTLHACSPNDTSVFTLKFTKWVVQGLSIRYRLDIDSTDIATIEYSVDGGHYWSNVMIDSTTYFWFYDSTNLSHSTPGWDSLTFYTDLSAVYGMPSDTIAFRFTFITGSSIVPRDGWMIDEIEIPCYTERADDLLPSANNLTLYPNPATSELTIQATDKITSIAIIDVLGNTVHRQTCNSQTVKVNIADLPAGIYLVRVNDEVVRKFVKK